MPQTPCQQAPSLWLDEDGENSLRASLICFTECSVRRKCLQAELAVAPVEGQWHVYGGYEGWERRRIMGRTPVSFSDPRRGRATQMEVAAFTGYRPGEAGDPMSGASMADLAEHSGRTEGVIRELLKSTLTAMRRLGDSDLLADTATSVRAA